MAIGSFGRTLLLIYLIAFGVISGAGKRDCSKPLGLEDGRIHDSQMIAPNAYNDNKAEYGPQKARLNHLGGYRAKLCNNCRSYIAVLLFKPYIITGIATQGYGVAGINEYTKQFFLGYANGNASSYFLESTTSPKAMEFEANNDTNTVVRHSVPVPATVTSIHLMPIWWEKNFAVRMELYGCVADGYECISTPCQNNGACIDLEAAYKCNCTEGFNGTNCEHNIDDCASSPCLHGGACIDLVNDFACNCTAGYTGRNCSIDINECISGPCLHGSTCVDGVNSYTCNCSPGYNGSRCQIDVNECEHHQCRHNGSCIDGINDYTCNCTAGYTGQRCEIDIDECQRSPCMHGGTCIDRINSFSCNCTVGFGGHRCEEELSFFLVVWLQLDMEKFDVQYLNESSSLYKSKATQVKKEVTSFVVQEYGFFFAEIRKFSPVGRDGVLAEVLISCLKNSTSRIERVIHDNIINSQSVFGFFFKSENRASTNCQPPKITSSLPDTLLSPLKVGRSLEFTTEYKVALKCAGSPPGIYLVDIYLLGSNGIFVRSRTQSGILASQIHYSIPARTLPYGIYYVKMTAQFDRVQGTSSNTFGLIEVTISPLIANITGQELVYQGLGKPVRLDGSASYDPDKGPANYTGIEFIWLCKRSSESFPHNITLVPVVKPSPSTKASGLGGCYGTGVGRLASSQEGKYLVDLDIDKMAGDMDYVIALVVRKDTREDWAYHRIRAVEEIGISLVCMQNCKHHMIPSSRLVVETRCTGLMCSNIYSYEWTLERYDAATHGWTKVPNLEAQILTYKNSPNLVTKENTLLGNSSYTLGVVARAPKGIVDTATYRFLTNSPPSGGKCTVDLKEGQAWETVFTFTCSEWHDEDLPLTYRFRYNTSDGVEMVFSSGVNDSPTARLPVGEEKNDFSLDIQVQVMDLLGSAALVKMKVKVIEPEMSSRLLEEAVGGDGEMNKYLRDNNIELAAQRATSVLSVVNHSPEKQMKLDQKLKIKDSIVDAWAPITPNVTKLQEVSLVAAVIVGVTDKKRELSVASQEKTVSLLGDMTSFFVTEVANETSDEKELIIQEAGSSLLTGMGNMVWMASEQAAIVPDPRRRRRIVNTVQEKSKELVKKTLGLVDQVGNSLSQTKELYEKPTVIKTRVMSVVIDRQIPSMIGGKSLEDQNAKVTLPPTKDLLRHNSGEDSAYLSTQMVSIKTNPYTWDSGASFIRSSVLDFKLRNANGSHIDINDLKEDINLFMSPLEAKPSSKPGNYFVKPSLNGSMQYHVISIPGKEYAVSITVKPYKAVNLTLYARARLWPTAFEYNYTATLPNYTFCANFSDEESFTNCSSDPFTVTISSAITGFTGLHYIGVRYESAEFSNVTEVDSRNSTSNHTRVKRDCFSGSGRQRRALCVGVKEPPTTPPPVREIIPEFDSMRDVNYTMVVSMATCLFWNPVQEQWTSQGCKVGPLARPKALHCQCNHLSAFGGDFFIAPNPIDFDVVFKRFENFDAKNFVVFFMVFGIFGLYLIALVFAVRADRKDSAKATENLRLASTSSEDNCYEISIYTGMWRNNGTTANVAVILYGQADESDVLPLTDRYGKRRLFARASVNTFIVSIPENIGTITKLKIWHDNSGSNPSWFLHQVAVSDLNNDNKTYFICNRWLAVDKEDGELEAEFCVATKNELSSFKYQFYSRLSKSLGDGHLWLSLLTRPPHSPFTCAQRLSCCLSVLYCAMVASAMFYQFGNNETSINAIKVGHLRLSLRQLVIGLQSALVVVPINLLIVTIFRNVKPARSSWSYAPNESNPKRRKQKPPGCLPHCFVYLGWFLCTSSALAAAAFTVFYSLSWGGELANQWLTSVLISLIQDIGVTQPLKVFTLAILLAVILKKPVEDKMAKSAVKSDLEVNKNDSVFPPKGAKLEEAREYRKNVLETVKAVGEIVLYLLFVMCLLVFVYANRGYERFRLTKSIDDIFTSSFNEITKLEDFWTWSRETLVPGLYDTKWYALGGAVMDEGYISNRESFLVGMPRFRQLRIKTVSPCQATQRYKTLDSYFQRCIPEYVPELEDRTPFNFPRWIPVTNMSMYGSLFDLKRLCPKPWRYISSGNLQSLPFYGELVKYDGGGYVADLGYNSPTALGVIADLQANSWLDERTVALFLEFTVFEPSTALFSHAKYLYETQPETGRPMLYRDIETLSLYANPDPSFRRFFDAIQIIILLLIFCYLIIEVGKMMSLKCAYFKSFWNWMNMLQLLAAIATVVLFFFKEDYVSRFVKNVHRNPYETTSMDYVILFTEMELYVLSTVVFIVTIKFLRLLRFNRHICQMTASMRYSWGRILTYAFVFLIDMVSFAFLAILVLGVTIENYSNFVEALSSLFQKFLGGEMHFYEIQTANRVIGPIFLFTYMLSMMFILINMFVAILNDSYDSVRHLSGGKFPDTELGHFIRKYYNEKFRSTFEILKRQFGLCGYRRRRFIPKKALKKDAKKKNILRGYSTFPFDDMSFCNIAYEQENEIERAPAKVQFVDEQQELIVPEECETGTTASAATENSTPELLDLLADLPESLVDDDDTLDNVRSKLSDIGAVLRLSKRSYRRFSTSGDKYVVEREFKLGPTVELKFTPRLDERKFILTAPI